MKTAVINPDKIQRKWYIVDANNMILGHLASRVANMLIGKGKTEYSPNQDHGDFVIVINSDKIVLSSDKADRKIYFSHSTHPGGAKFRSFREQMNQDSRKVIIDAVHGMVPQTALGRKILSKLHVYKDANHLHAAQKPETVKLN